MDDKHEGWAQGRFIDGPQYTRQNVSWKREQEVRERLLVRPSPKGNAICQTTDPTAAEWIARRLNLAAKIEAERDKYRDMLRMLIDNNDYGSYESEGQCRDAARKLLGLQQSTIRSTK